MSMMSPEYRVIINLSQRLTIGYQFAIYILRVLLVPWSTVVRQRLRIRIVVTVVPIVANV